MRLFIYTFEKRALARSRRWFFSFRRGSGTECSVSINEISFSIVRNRKCCSSRRATDDCFVKSRDFTETNGQHFYPDFRANESNVNDFFNLFIYRLNPSPIKNTEILYRIVTRAWLLLKIISKFKKKNLEIYKINIYTLIYRVFLIYWY